MTVSPSGVMIRIAHGSLLIRCSESAGSDVAVSNGHQPVFRRCLILAVENHAQEVAKKAGSIDVCFNAFGMNAVQGIPLVDMLLEDFLTPVTEAAHSHFVSATAAVRRMTGAKLRWDPHAGATTARS